MDLTAQPSAPIKNLPICTYCNREYKSGPSLARHIRTHTGEKPFRCSACTRPFATWETMKKHFTEAHDKPAEVPRRSCVLCPRTFASKSGFDAHKLWHTGAKPFQCGFCVKSFNTPGQLRVHERVHTGVKPYTCTYCEMTFAGNNALRGHITTHTGEQPYQCPVLGCNYTSGTKPAMNLHSKTHNTMKPHECQNCAKQFKTRQQLQVHKRSMHQESVEDKPYQCDYCAKRFMFPNILMEHMQMHTGEKYYGCDVCEKRFTQKRTAVRHKRSFHPETVPPEKRTLFKCSRENCDKTFVHKISLNLHVKHGHMAVRNYKCEKCGKDFPFRERLERHEFLHSGEKPFKCPAPGCGYAAARKDGLVGHQRNRHHLQ